MILFNFLGKVRQERIREHRMCEGEIRWRERTN